VDLILLDTGAGLSPAVMGPLARADLALVVTNPEPAAVTDAYALLKVWHQQGRSLPAGLVINRVRGREEAFLTATRLRGVARRFLGCRPELIGWLPDSPGVADSARHRRPFFLHLEPGEEREAMRTMADRLLRALERGVPAPPDRGMDGRMG
jgi:flagellar biosynthesis protein FlhG